jgi:cell division protein FtsQ
MDIQELQRQRRRQLRWQARQRFWITIWRTVAIAGFALVLLWMTTLPQWVLHYPSQVTIRGNQYLSSESVLALLPLKPKQVLWQIHPQEIAQVLSNRAPIQSATVTRQLFPTQLIVEVQDRPPVAIMECNRCTVLQFSQSANRPPILPVPIADNTWLIDPNGIVAPLSSYDMTVLQQRGRFPKLKVIGLLQPLSAKENQMAASLMSSAGAAMGVKLDLSKQQQWAKLLQELGQSPIEVKAIEWQYSQGLILQTELGTVRLGPYSAQFPEQLKVLDQMRTLPEKLDPKRLDYIDLTDPKHPILQNRTSSKP